MTTIKKYDIDPANLDADGIAESQAVVVLTTPNLVLNGALCDLGTALQFDIGDAYSTGIGGVKLLFDSAGDINTNVFTITGKNQDGQSVTETVTGVTTTPVSTVKYYSQVTLITASIDTTSNVFVGTVTGELSTPSATISKRDRSIGATVAVGAVVGTCNFDIQQTFDNTEDTSVTPVWHAVAAGKTADFAATAAIGAKAVRVKFSSYTDGAEAQFYVAD
jgi:hypothetical protein